MKKTIRTLALVLSLAVTFSACKKDKDEDKASNFTYNGKTYTTVYAQNEADANGSYSNFLLVSGDISSAAFTGKISGVNILFDNATVTEGTYTYKNDSDPTYNAKTNFFDASVFVDISFPDFDGGEMLDNITAGTVTVTKSGSGFIFVYELNFDGKVVSGRYSGAVKEIN
jgi:hypothetical protein